MRAFLSVTPAACPASFEKLGRAIHTLEDKLPLVSWNPHFRERTLLRRGSLSFLEGFRNWTKVIQYCGIKICLCIMTLLLSIYFSGLGNTPSDLSCLPSSHCPHSPPLILGESSPSKTVTAITKIENSV